MKEVKLLVSFPFTNKEEEEIILKRADPFLEDFVRSFPKEEERVVMKLDKDVIVLFRDHEGEISLKILEGNVEKMYSSALFSSLELLNERSTRILFK